MSEHEKPAEIDRRADDVAALLVAYDELEAKMLAAFERDPKVAETADVYRLFKVEGFDLGRLQPTYAEACVVFGRARAKWRARMAAAAAGGGIK